MNGRNRNQFPINKNLAVNKNLAGVRVPPTPPSSSQQLPSSGPSVGGFIKILLILVLLYLLYLLYQWMADHQMLNFEIDFLNFCSKKEKGYEIDVQLYDSEEIDGEDSISKITELQKKIEERNREIAKLNEYIDEQNRQRVKESVSPSTTSSPSASSQKPTIIYVSAEDS